MTTDKTRSDLSGLVAVVTGAAAGLGRAEAIGLARAGATVVVNDMAAALDKSDVLDEIAAAGAKAVAVAGDISAAQHRRRTRRDRRRARRAVASSSTTRASPATGCCST